MLNSFVGNSKISGFENGHKESSLFGIHLSCTFSPNGDSVLICDYLNHCIRQLDIESGIVSTFAGTPREKGFANGSSNEAKFFYPFCCKYSPDGSIVLVCDKGNNCIRRIDVKTREVSVLAGMPGIPGFTNGNKETALFNAPCSLTFFPDGRNVLICEPSQHCIRSICIETGHVSNFAGKPGKFGLRNGNKNQALFKTPSNATFTPDGKSVLICDSWNGCIRSICLKTENVTTMDSLRYLVKCPVDCDFSHDGTKLFICDWEFYFVRAIDLKTKQYENIYDTISRNDNAKFFFYKPDSLACNPTGNNMLVCRSANSCIFNAII